MPARISSTDCADSPPRSWRQAKRRASPSSSAATTPRPRSTTSSRFGSRISPAPRRRTGGSPRARAGYRPRSHEQPGGRHRRLAVAAHGRRDRHRRHAVPRRLGHGRARAPRPRGAARRAPGGGRAPRRRRQPARRRRGRGHGNGDRATDMLKSPSRSCTSRSSAPPTPASSRRCTTTSCACSATSRRRRPTGRRCSRRPTRSPTRSNRSRPPVDARERDAAVALLRWMADDHFMFTGYREYSLRESQGSDVLTAVPGSGLGILRERPDADAAGGVSFARLPTGAAPPRPREDAARAHQGQRAIDGAPFGVSRLRGREAVRRAGRGLRRAALRRALHVGGLPLEPARHPAAAREGRRRRRPRRFRAPEPQRARPARGARELPARRAVPGVGRRAVRRPRWGSCSSRSAGGSGCSSATIRTAASCRASSTCRAIGTRPSCGSRSPTSCTRRSARPARSTRCS